MVVEGRKEGRTLFWCFIPPRVLPGGGRTLRTTPGIRLRGHLEGQLVFQAQGRMAWSCEGGRAVWPRGQSGGRGGSFGRMCLASPRKGSPEASVTIPSARSMSLGWGHSGPSILTFIGSDHVSTWEDQPVRWGGQMLSHCEESNLMRGASETAPESPLEGRTQGSPLRKTAM